MLKQLLLLQVQRIILVLLLLLLALPVLGSTLLLVNLLGAAGVPLGSASGSGAANGAVVPAITALVNFRRAPWSYNTL